MHLNLVGILHFKLICIQKFMYSEFCYFDFKLIKPVWYFYMLMGAFISTNVYVYDVYTAY